MLTTSSALILVALLLITGLICAVWAFVEHMRTLAARRRRAAQAARRDAIAAARVDQPPSAAAEWVRLLVDDDHVAARFEALVHRNPALSSRLIQLWAGIEPDKEQAS